MHATSSWNSSATAGIFRPGASQYPSGVPDGVNIAYSGGGAVIDQILSATLTANTTYTLTVDVGNRLDAPQNDGYTIQLLAGGVLLSSASTPIPTAGSFVTVTDIYTAGAGDAQLGEALEIQLVSVVTGQANFDNVKLDATAVPEPCSFLLLGLTAAGVGWRRWRKK